MRSAQQSWTQCSNILILTADDRAFELPPGFGERLHAGLEEEIRGMEPAPATGE
jgi:hypothetical protein